jgi:predicted transcriptional regulator
MCRPTLSLVENASAFGLTQADIAEQLGIDEKTLRKHFRVELNGGKFKADMLAGKTVTELMRSKDERVRLDAAKSQGSLITRSTLLVSTSAVRSTGFQC